jgi:hypothetical protein
VRLVELGASVLAVELGPGLAQRLRARTAGLSVEVVVGDFDTVDVPGGPFDLAVSATAFHWLDAAVALPKLARLLQSQGWLAVWWTHYGPPDQPSDVSIAIDEVCQRHQDLDGPSAPWVLDVDTVSAGLAEGGYFGVADVEFINWETTHTAAELRRLFLTHSTTLALELDTRAALLDDLEAMVNDRFGGTITREYVTPLYIVRRRESTAPTTTP